MSNDRNCLDRELFFSDSQRGINMIAVCSGAYGTGKTWLALTLAHAFAAQRKKILFFDADWGNDNISSYLGIKNEHTLSDAVYRNLTLNQIVLHSEKTGYDILSGDKESAGLSTLPVGRLQLLSEDLTLISKNYDNILLDISSEKQKSSNIIAGIAKTNLLIISPNPQSLTNGYEIIRKMKTQYPSNKIYIVVNQVNTKREGVMIYNTLADTTARYLNITPELIGIVRNDTRIRDCQRNQALLLSRYPTSDAALDVLEIARKLMQKE